TASQGPPPGCPPGATAARREAPEHGNEGFRGSAWGRADGPGRRAGTPGRGGFSVRGRTAWAPYRGRGASTRNSGGLGRSVSAKPPRWGRDDGGVTAGEPPPFRAGDDETVYSPSRTVAP